MAKTRISNTQSASHNSSVIEGLRTVEFDISSNVKEFASDGEDVQSSPVGFKVTGSAVFDNVSAYNQALGNAESNLTITCLESDNTTTKTITIKNVKFSATRGSLPTLQDRDVATFTLNFTATPGASDTIDTMITVS